MKKTQLILAAAALVVFASCTNDNYTPNGKVDNEIGFNAVTRLATRANNAIITGSEYGKDNTFNVWGWQSEKGDYTDVPSASNFMTDLTISWTGGRDSRTEAWRNALNYYYWPFTGRIAFLAVHPSDVNASVTASWNSTNKVPRAEIEDYTISAANDSTDLMFANNEGARQAEALPMVFKHALSQIQFRVRTNDDYTLDNVVFKVDSVKINNIDLSGDVVYAWNTELATPAMDITWTDNAAQTQVWDYFKTTQVVNYAATDAAADLYGRAHVMIPQAANVLALPDDDVQTTLTVGYTMKQKDYAAISGTVTVAAPQAWEAGKRYLYTLNFRLNEILFNPSVTEWVDVAVETINIL